MSEWRQANVNANYLKGFEIATDITWRFSDDKIRTAYVIFAALNMPDSILFKIISDMNCLLIPDIERILMDRDLFEEIFGKEAAVKLFDVPEEEEEEDDADEALNPEEQKIVNTVLSVLAEIFDNTSSSVPSMIVPIYSDKLEQACEDAYERCKAMNLNYIDFDVLVYSILKYKETSAYKFTSMIFKSLGIEMQDLMRSILINANIVDDVSVGKNIVTVPVSLENCIEVLNDKYEKGSQITILGRDKEMYKLFNIFSKKTKRNAILIGYPGVGKTAIIEAVTQNIVNGTCPKEFIGYTVLSLDVNAMVAGTKYRGEFETKVAMLKDFLESTPNVILFVDEMHQMLGAGSTSEGTVDLSGSLKPILARDDALFVGATTIKEYKTIVARDGAFKRRFEEVFVREPKNHEVKAMIEVKIQNMEKHHGVTMPRELVDYIILCSNCFNTENANPDKTLDLCDRSMAVAKMDGVDAVTYDCINKVYDQYFEKYSNIPEKYIRAIAYHEIGHYLATKLSKEHEAYNVVAVSIIPASDYMGINILEETENYTPCDMEYVKAYLMSLLAGRVAQQKATGIIDSGASSDLRKAKEFAKAVITEFGMDESELKNIYLMDEELLNEKLTEAINEKVMKLIKMIYDQTVKFVEDNWSTIEKMARYLMKHRIVTDSELDKLLQE